MGESRGVIMPDYKADLQTNNTNLQTVLATVQNLSSGSGSSTETWTLTTADGGTKTEQVGIAEVCQVTYNLDGGITSSNTSTFVRIGDVYETILSSGDEIAGSYYKSIIVYLDYHTNGRVETGGGYQLEEEFYPDEECPWLVNIAIPAEDTSSSYLTSITIEATLGGWGWDEEDGLE
jgi:hypothetical protein